MEKLFSLFAPAIPGIIFIAILLIIIFLSKVLEFLITKTIKHEHVWKMLTGDGLTIKRCRICGKVVVLEDKQ